MRNLGAVLPDLKKLRFINPGAHILVECKSVKCHLAIVPEIPRLIPMSKHSHTSLDACLTPYVYFQLIVITPTVKCSRANIHPNLYISRLSYTFRNPKVPEEEVRSLVCDGQHATK